MTKIANFLKNKEGCEVIQQNYTINGIQAVIQDSFGYRYEINIRTLSRLGSNIEDTTNNPYLLDAALQKSIKSQG
jgi:hypothetical protein